MNKSLIPNSKLLIRGSLVQVQKGEQRYQPLTPKCRWVFISLPHSCQVKNIIDSNKWFKLNRKKMFSESITHFFEHRRIKMPFWNSRNYKTANEHGFEFIMYQMWARGIFANNLYICHVIINTITWNCFIHFSVFVFCLFFLLKRKTVHMRGNLLLVLILAQQVPIKYRVSTLDFRTRSQWRLLFHSIIKVVFR